MHFLMSHAKFTANDKILIPNLLIIEMKTGNCYEGSSTHWLPYKVC